MVADASMDASTVCQDNLEKAEDLLAKGDRAKARAVLETIVATEELSADEADEIRAKEQAIYQLANLYVTASDGKELIALLTRIRSFFALLPKAKATRMVRRVFENIVLCGVPLTEQQAVCVETIHWARRERRTFLRHRLQLRLAEVQFEQRDPRTALTTLLALLREVRRLDDRTLLLDVHLLESKILYAIKNISRARAALVSARTTANSIYCPPLAQAEIDLQSGVLHAEEHDYKTAYSYLFEAFEGFHQLGNQAQLARRALHYMIVAKVFCDNTDELKAMLSSKNVLEYTGEDMDTLRGIADAYVTQDTHRFNAVLQKNTAAATQPTGSASAAAGDAAAAAPEHSAVAMLRDEVIARQLRDMYDKLVERHLLKVVQPYHRVQISYLASLLRLEEGPVEERVSQLILDKKLLGIVDQHHGCLVVFDDVERKKPSSSSAAAAPGEAEGKSAEDSTFYENAADAAEAERRKRTTLHQDALTALEKYDALVTALFDKVGGKFDALVEERLAKRQPQKSAGSDGDKGKTKDAEKDSDGTDGTDKTAAAKKPTAEDGAADAKKPNDADKRQKP